MEQINFINSQTYKENNPEKYNQLWIEKAIEEGHINFLPVHKFPGKSIGDHIKIKYEQLNRDEFNRYYLNEWLDDYDHLINDRPKVTQKESLLYIRELILKAYEEGNLKQIEQILSKEECQKDVVKDFLEQETILFKQVRIKRRLQRWIKTTK